MHALRKLVGDERMRRVRQEDLPAVGGGHDASGASDLGIPLVIGGPVGGVDSHSRADGVARPGKRVKAALSCHRRENGARRVGEGREERIPRGRGDRPVVRGNRVAKNPVVLCELPAERLP